MLVENNRRSSNAFYSESTQTKASITILPTELLFHIFSFLSVREMVQKGLTCHYWRSIISSKSLWNTKIPIQLKASDSTTIYKKNYQQLLNLPSQLPFSPFPTSHKGQTTSVISRCGFIFVGTDNGSVSVYQQKTLNFLTSITIDPEKKIEALEANKQLLVCLVTDINDSNTKEIQIWEKKQQALDWVYRSTIRPDHSIHHLSMHGDYLFLQYSDSIKIIDYPSLKSYEIDCQCYTIYRDWIYLVQQDKVKIYDYHSLKLVKNAFLSISKDNLIHFININDDKILLGISDANKQTFQIKTYEMNHVYCIDFSKSIDESESLRYSSSTQVNCYPYLNHIYIQINKELHRLTGKKGKFFIWDHCKQSLHSITHELSLEFANQKLIAFSYPIHKNVPSQSSLCYVDLNPIETTLSLIEELPLKGPFSFPCYLFKAFKITLTAVFILTIFIGSCYLAILNPKSYFFLASVIVIFPLQMPIKKYINSLTRIIKLSTCFLMIKNQLFKKNLIINLYTAKELRNFYQWRFERLNRQR